MSSQDVVEVLSDSELESVVGGVDVDVYALVGMCRCGSIH